VRFLVDAQLPVRLARHLAAAGHDCVHTSELPDGNRSTDRSISLVADADDRVVITKDRDFRDSHLLVGRPRRLLEVTTGNIRNDDLIVLFETNLTLIIESLEEARYVAISPDRLVVHRSTESES